MGKEKELNEEELNEKVDIEFNKGELFQLHLALISRSATLTGLWANSVNDEDRDNYSLVLNVTNDLIDKINDYLNATDEEENK